MGAILRRGLRWLGLLVALSLTVLHGASSLSAAQSLSTISANLAASPLGLPSWPTALLFTLLNASVLCLTQLHRVARNVGIALLWVVGALWYLFVDAWAHSVGNLLLQQVPGVSAQIGISPFTMLAILVCWVQAGVLRARFAPLTALFRAWQQGQAFKLLLGASLLVPLLSTALNAGPQTIFDILDEYLLGAAGVLAAAAVGYEQLRAQKIEAARNRRKTKYTQDRALMESALVTICAYSNKFKLDDTWVDMPTFLASRFGIRLTHGIAPEMVAEFEAMIDAEILKETNNVTSPILVDNSQAKLLKARESLEASRRFLEKVT